MGQHHLCPACHRVDCHHGSQVGHRGPLVDGLEWAVVHWNVIPLPQQLVVQQVVELAAKHSMCRAVAVAEGHPVVPTRILAWVGFAEVDGPVAGRGEDFLPVGRAATPLAQFHLHIGPRIRTSNMSRFFSYSELHS